jgi:hypothetical protein
MKVLFFARKNPQNREFITNNDRIVMKYPHICPIWDGFLPDLIKIWAIRKGELSQ